MLTIKQQIEADIKNIGRNHLNSKISALLDFGGDLCSPDIKTLADACTLVADRVKMYQDIIEERYT